MHAPAPEPHNPYAAPEAPLVEVAEPGSMAQVSRWRRLGGYLIDNVLIGAVMLPSLMAAHFGWLHSISLGNGDLLTALAVILSVVLYLVIQCALLYHRGQTIGKLAMGTRIVDHERGEIVFWRTAGVRYLLVAVLQGLPLVGGVFFVVNALFIFREDRRCIHDLMAGTRVVAA